LRELENAIIKQFSTKMSNSEISNQNRPPTSKNIISALAAKHIKILINGSESHVVSSGGGGTVNVIVGKV
jgi:hypothetical protein